MDVAHEAAVVTEEPVALRFPTGVILAALLAAWIGLMALAPTLQYIRWNREARVAPAFAPLTREVDRVRASIAFGLGLWLILPLLAILVARGYGLP